MFEVRRAGNNMLVKRTTILKVLEENFKNFFSKGYSSDVFRIFILRDPIERHNFVLQICAMKN